MLWDHALVQYHSISVLCFKSVWCCCSDFSVCIGLSPTLLIVNVWITVQRHFAFMELIFLQVSAIPCKRHSGWGILFLVETAVQTEIDSKSWSLFLGNFSALMLQQYIISWWLRCWTSSKWGVLLGSGQYVIRSEVFWFCLFFKNASVLMLT